ncbi:CHAT domain-containing protein [Chaetomium strumarium]|uniref:CHAT domain-containing protein n=1 Tax=Chaetomium strumarium TaxID=1170767 RepID=A0AAJ0GXC3_9PEZI|nr:CHAT domain-containing protein [Chaetomium strumarium]
MIRYPQILPGQTQQPGIHSGAFPDPVLARRDKYWALSRHRYPDQDDPAKLPAPEVGRTVEDINFIEVLEAHQPWKMLKLPILCRSCCDGDDLDSFHIDNVHWRYLHCTRCPGFFLCGNCLEKGDPAIVAVLLYPHAQHGRLIIITSRPYWSPVFDGGDLDQLLAFKQAGTSMDEFFLYFPWFFHSFEGMDQLRLVYQHALLQSSPIQDLLRSLSLGPGDPVEVPTSESDDIYRFISAPVDWYMRIYATGNWEQFHARVEPLVDERIHVARRSAALSGLLEQLHGSVEEKISKYGEGDIAYDAAALYASGFLEALMPSKFACYLVPLHVTGSLNGDINREKLRRVVRPCREDGQDLLVSAGDHGHHLFAGTSMGSHLSNFLFTEGDRLWPMFKAIFEDDDGFGKLRTPLVFNDFVPYMQYTSGEWDRFLARELAVRNALFEIQYQVLPTDTNLAQLPESIGSPDASSIAETAFRHRLFGDYDKAATLMPNKPGGGDEERRSSPSLEDVLEVQLCFLEQGCLRKAESYLRYLSNGAEHPGQAVHELAQTSAAAACIYAISLYAMCFRSPTGWEAALTLLPTLFHHHCLPPDDAIAQGYTRKDLLLRVQLEIIFHKTVLAAYRDILRHCPQEAAIRRLQSIQDHLAPQSDDIQVAAMLWQVALLEMEMKKKWVRDQYLQHEASFSMTHFLHDEQASLQIIERFQRSLLGQGGQFDVLRGHAALLEARLHLDAGRRPSSAVAASRAMELYRDTGCAVGCLDVEILHSPLTYASIGPLYDKLRARNDLGRLRVLRKMAVDTTGGQVSSSETACIHTTAATWRSRQVLDLRGLALEAGDMISYHRWNMRKYAGDEVVGACIQASEEVLKGDAVVHSTVLATMASFNLAKAYLTLGNHFAASLNALFHLSLTSIQNDAESHQTAVLSALHCFSEAVAAEPRLQSRFPALKDRWNGWLESTALRRWDQGQPRCDEIERFIDGACFLPSLAGRIERAPENGVLARDPSLEDALIDHLRVAFGLYAAMPVYAASAIVPRLAHALGAVAGYIGNAELAIRCYWEGIRCCHSEDTLSVMRLRLEAGKLMVALGNRDPEHWMHVVDPGRLLLASAAADMASDSQLLLSGSALYSIEANLWLVSSLLDEARACKTMLDMAIAAPPEDDDSSSSGMIRDMLLRVVKLIRRAENPISKIEQAFDTIADGVRIDSPFELNFNLVRLAENPLFREAKQLALELGLIAKDFDRFANRQRGAYFWVQVQRFKGTVLGYQYRKTVPRAMLDRLMALPAARRLYQEEAALMDELPHSRLDGRLGRHRLAMLQDPDLLPLLLRRVGRRPTLEEMSSLVRDRVNSSNKLPQPSPAAAATSAVVIFIDWILYRGHFYICGFNASDDGGGGTLCIQQHIRELDVPTIEQWIRDHVEPGGDLLTDPIGAATALNSIRMLVAPISAAAAANRLPRGATLIFSPSLCLNRIPLHALPYGRDDDEPVIQYHPVMYAPSCAALRDCVERALDDDDTRSRVGGAQQRLLQARLFDCYGTDDDDDSGGKSSHHAMAELATVLEERGRGAGGIPFTVTTRDRGVSAAELRALLPDADLVHFHGHVDGRNLEKFLHLKLDVADQQQQQQRQQQSPSPLAELPATGTATDAETETTFKLQDIYASTLTARLVLLIGCGSGELVVSRGDDALGLVNGFLAAGATTVVSTLWPLDNRDGRDFARHFYLCAFGGGEGGQQEQREQQEQQQQQGQGGSEECRQQQQQQQLIDLATAIQSAVRAMRTCQRRGCLRTRKEPGERLRCHPSTPYHWAPFVGWGSWVLGVQNHQLG